MVLHVFIIPTLGLIKISIFKLPPPKLRHDEFRDSQKSVCVYVVQRVCEMRPLIEISSQLQGPAKNYLLKKEKRSGYKIYFEAEEFIDMNASVYSLWLW
jgi:hypothetical protein